MRSLFVFLSLLLFAPAGFSAPQKLLVLGDSLSEGYGVAREQAYPALLQKKIQDDKKDWIVINAGVSGSTSASGPSRLKWQLKNKPQILMLALGANDGLRGLPVNELEKNLSATIELAQKNQITVILVGMMMPPNYTQDYAKSFREVYPRLAKKYKLKFIPFLLEGVAAKADLNQPDGIHPNEKGHQIIAEQIWKQIKGWL